MHEITSLTREIKACRMEIEKKQHELNLREMQVGHSPLCQLASFAEEPFPAVENQD